MYRFAIYIGIYSYFIFLLGIIGFLNIYIINFSFLLFTIFIISYYKEILNYKILSNFKKQNLIFKLLFFIFILLIFVNLLGVLGPELAYDALWYHLTFPKLWLKANEIDYISGGLFYYSVMPKLAETLYIVGLSLGSEIYSKLFHFIFGLLSSIVLYQFSRQFSKSTISLSVVLIFYSNLVVAWESITAYIDLSLCFFFTLAISAFTNYIKSNSSKWLIISSIMFGLAVSTKLLILSSLPAFIILIIIKKNKIYHKIKHIFIFVLFCTLIPLPWFLFSFLNTGLLFYPFFTSIYEINSSPLNPFFFIKEIFNLFLFSADPLSPIYLIFLPLFLNFYKRLKYEIKLICIFIFLGLIIWYLIPRTGGGRFIIPYLPILSLLIGIIIEKFKPKNTSSLSIYNFLVFLVISISIISITYRFFANLKYIPYIFAIESKSKFLQNHLNFSYGDFYDTDNYFANNIKKSDKVLLINFHNLFYISFPFVDQSQIKKGEFFNYIATQNTNLPKQFDSWSLIYKNSMTHVKLYSRKDKQWAYWK